MTLRVTLAFAALFCGLISPICGAKAVPNAHQASNSFKHLVGNHQDLNQAKHAAAAHAPSQHAAAHLPLKHVAAHQPAIHATAQHPAHHATAQHPAHHATAQHPAHHATAQHPVKALNGSDPLLPILYHIPDILGEASQVFGESLFLLKKYIGGPKDKGRAEALQAMIRKTESVRRRLLKTTTRILSNTSYQKSLLQMLREVIVDMKIAGNWLPKGLGGANFRKRDNIFPPQGPHKSNLAPRSPTRAQRPRHPDQFIPVVWEAVVMVKPEELKRIPHKDIDQHLKQKPHSQKVSLQHLKQQPLSQKVSLQHLKQKPHSQKVSLQHLKQQPLSQKVSLQHLKQQPHSQKVSLPHSKNSHLTSQPHQVGKLHLTKNTAFHATQAKQSHL